MGPIMAAGLALAAGDFILTLRSLCNIFVSCIVAVAFATLLVSLLPFREMTTEIAARTNPNTLDLVVALFSGAVAALATSKSLRGVATSIPGVAIAVALMPPLCVTGYGVGVLLTVDRAQGLGVLRGGALLFLTNLIAITFSTMLVFLLLHVDGEPVRTRIREWRKSDPESAAVQRLLERLPLPRETARIGSLPARLVVLAIMTAAIFVPLKRSFDALSREIAQRNALNVVQRKATDLWQERFASTAAGQPRSYIDMLEAKEADGRTLLNMRVFSSRALNAEERSAYVQTLARSLRRDPKTISLALVEVPTSGFEIATRSRTEPAKAAEPGVAEQLEAARRRAVDVLAATPLPPGAFLLDSAITFRGSGVEAALAYLAPTPFGSDAQALIARDVQTRLGFAARVLLQWVPQRAAVAFPARSTALAPAAREQVLAIGRTLLAYPELVATVIAADAAERSAARATAVAEALRASGVPGSRLRASLAPAGQMDEAVVTVSLAKASSGAAGS
jgi:uncharacterized hydrophobic protein (TIGR00271 family)